MLWQYVKTRLHHSIYRRYDWLQFPDTLSRCRLAADQGVDRQQLPVEGLERGAVPNADVGDARLLEDLHGWIRTGAIPTLQSQPE